MMNPLTSKATEGPNVTGGKKSSKRLRYATRRTPFHPLFILFICIFVLVASSFMAYDNEFQNLGPWVSKLRAKEHVVELASPHFPEGAIHLHLTHKSVVDQRM